MERFDLKFVLHTIQENMRKGTLNTQDGIIDNLFESFYYSNEAKTNSIGQSVASKVFDGKKILVPIARYYEEHRDKLLQAVENYLLPALFDKGNVAQIIYNVIENDNSLSRNMVLEFKNLLPGSDRDTYAMFFEKVIYEAISRPPEKQDEKELNADSPADRYPIPRPCRYFRGRDTELNQIRDRLGRFGSLVLTGCQSIGKSEVAKAYAQRFSILYRHTIYLPCTPGQSLKQSITEMTLTTQSPEQSSEARFAEHMRILKNLDSNTLLLIDNLDVIDDPTLFDLINLNYDVLVTTRCVFQDIECLEITEMKELQDLIDLVKHFYPLADQYLPEVTTIIEAVYRHTHAVELAARLLHLGISSPPDLAAKFIAQRSNLDVSDTFSYIKDGKRSTSDTYRKHIHFLFSLCTLSPIEREIMKYMTLMPVNGIPIRLFANWIGETENLNNINRLITMGFIRETEYRDISLYPILRETTISTEAPSISDCHLLLENIRYICLQHGRDEPHYLELFQTIENIVHTIRTDDLEFYLKFVRDIIPFMHTYSYKDGIKLLCNEMEEILRSGCPHCKNDIILLIQYRIMFEPDSSKCIDTYTQMLTLLEKPTFENAALFSNTLCNLSLKYMGMGNLDLAEKKMAEAIKICYQFGLMNTHDYFSQLQNYANILLQQHKITEANKILDYVGDIIKKQLPTNSSEYADYLQQRAHAYLLMNQKIKGVSYCIEALKLYASIFGERSSRYIQELIYTKFILLHTTPPIIPNADTIIDI